MNAQAAALALLLILPYAALPAIGSGGAPDTGICYLRDPYFENGLTIYDPRESAGHQATGRLAGLKQADDRTVWGLSQWNTQTPFVGTPRPANADPSIIRYTSGSKEVTLGLSGTDLADISLHLNSSKEYDARVRSVAERWPALYVWQRFDGLRPLSELSGVAFTMDARLVSFRNLHQPGTYDRQKHAAQFSVLLTLQNRTRGSSDFGRYIWFVIPLFDNRFEHPPGHEQEDKFTHKFIYQVDSSILASGSLTQGRWVHYQVDLYREMRNAVQHARAAGYFANSTIRDFYIAAATIGWEMPGSFDAEMQFKDFNICIN